MKIQDTFQPTKNTVLCASENPLLHAGHILRAISVQPLPELIILQRSQSRLPCPLRNGTLS